MLCDVDDAVFCPGASIACWMDNALRISFPLTLTVFSLTLTIEKVPLSST